MQPDTKTGMPDMRKSEARDLLKRVKDRYKIMAEFDHDNRQRAMEDLKFANLPGEQWDYNMKQERGKRPCYEFNKTRISVKRVINDMRSNRPGAKVRATENGDPQIAEISEGLIRNIAEQSDFETITDYEAEYQVAAGMCAWRVNTKYTHDDAFNQEIVVEPFRNPFTVYSDPQCRDLLKRDARDWIVTEKIAKSSFEERWPDATVVEFQGSGDGDEYDDEGDWTSEKTVRIAEYWYKKPMKKEIWEVIFAPKEEGEEPSTKIVDSTTDEARGIDPQQIKRRRTINSHQICWVVCSGDRILEKGEWAGPDFPFVMIYGEYAWIDGQPHWWGLTRFAKDPQRAYNIDRTAMLETIAQAPKSYFWATAKQAEGHTNEWMQAHKKNYPYMLYEPDERAPGPPSRIGGADVPVALIQSCQMSSDELKSVTGIFDASMGASGNETSGKAIFARQAQGEIATFNFQDNMSKGVQRTYEIILNLIPHIYDTQRELRILGSDGSEDYKKVNKVVIDPMTKQMVKVNDLAEGKYDVTVTSGPSFSTLRQEAAEVYVSFAQQYPEIMSVAGDLIMKSMDLPYADDISERLRTLLPPQIQEQLDADEEMSPEVQQAMQKVQQAMQMVEEKGQMVLQAEQELEDKKNEVADQERQNDVAAKDVEIRIERLRRVKAEFDAHVAKEVANLDQKSQDLQAAEKNGEDPSQAIIAVATAVRNIDDTLAAFMQATDQQFSQMSSVSAGGGGNLPGEDLDDMGDVDGELET
jgi:hypothetical protein